MENAGARLEAFCDGVFAIAITLLIIEIKIPAIESVNTNKELWMAFAHAWPSWLAFFVRFIIILISWTAHSNGFKLLKSYLLNLLMPMHYCYYPLLFCHF